MSSFSLKEFRTVFGLLIDRIDRLPEAEAVALGRMARFIYEGCGGEAYVSSEPIPLARARKFIAGFEPGTRCAYCLQPTDAPARDHIVPFSAGGNESYDNIVPACRPCNSRKGAKSLLQFVAEGGLGELPEWRIERKARRLG